MEFSKRNFGLLKITFTTATASVWEEYLQKQVLMEERIHNVF